MKRILAMVACTALLSGCAANKGRIEKVGTITIEGFEFSNCDKAERAMIELKDDGIYLCGYSLNELGGIGFYDLRFNGESEISIKE